MREISRDNGKWFVWKKKMNAAVSFLMSKAYMLKKMPQVLTVLQVKVRK